MIVGADRSHDAHFLKRAGDLYRDFKLRRVYYSAFSPIPDASARLPLQAVMFQVEHELGKTQLAVQAGDLPGVTQHARELRKWWRDPAHDLYIHSGKITKDKEGFLDKVFNRVKELSGANQDINFREYPEFSSKFLLSGENEEAIRHFFSQELVDFLTSNEIHHIESNGEALMIFKYIRIARTDEVQNMLNFAHDLLAHMHLKKVEA